MMSKFTKKYVLVPILQLGLIFLVSIRNGENFHESSHFSASFAKWWCYTTPVLLDTPPTYTRLSCTSVPCQIGDTNKIWVKIALVQ